eukprot:gb/GFBE01077550.1/.p1 GENE.gb/GFBE01077550.1/~~gb/GFBE01077550.1/.p1  ORF type:complete len:185 (+),score=35.62 gb/GFBE01077550.1/:1-555(+)
MLLARCIAAKLMITAVLALEHDDVECSSVQFLQVGQEISSMDVEASAAGFITVPARSAEASKEDTVGEQIAVAEATVPVLEAEMVERAVTGAAAALLEVFQGSGAAAKSEKAELSVKVSTVAFDTSSTVCIVAGSVTVAVLVCVLFYCCSRSRYDSDAQEAKFLGNGLSATVTRTQQQVRNTCC